ncbi:DUF461 domain-containing protein [Kitasatospora fiedleri]|uniref:DUF461 domain-containing protein n=1 Tax=Kitasatospora fiedleri TaxID=2991545 RepID=UPI002499C267|nr:DUF461 domain-containing protein [Kitasatospora fiedleri]
MSRSLRRGAVAAIVLAAIVPLAACAAGNDASTLQIKPDNAATAIGSDVKLNNIVVVTPGGTAGEYTGPANVTVNVANTGDGPEVLTSLKVGDTAAKLTDKSGAAVDSIALAPGESVLLGAEGGPLAAVPNADVSVGGYVKTTFTFKNAGEVSANANVQPADGLYEGYGPAKASPSAPASPAASASASAGASVSAGASTSPSAGASTSPSAGATGSASAPAAPSGSATAG